MPETKIGSAIASDMENTETLYSVAPQQTDAATGDKETEYINSEWNNQLGYYTTVPKLKNSIDAKAKWFVGKGYEADEITTIILDRIRGWGNDSFNTILGNCIMCYETGGDSYCEIIREENGLVNLKPLDPGVMKTITNSKGIIIKYHQMSKANIKKVAHKFDPEEIFHLSRDRIADQIHGTSLITAIKKILLAKEEAMDDWQIMLHRFVFPRWIIHLDSDDATEVAAFKVKMDDANAKGENFYIPKGIVVPEMMAVPANSTLNSLPWITMLNEDIFEATGVPEIIAGTGKQFTDGASKIKYVAWQQTVEAGQLYIEEQVLAQLGFEINLIFPADLMNDMLSDKQKDPNQLEPVEENDVTAETEGVK